MTPAVTALILGNILMYLLAGPGSPLWYELGLFPGAIISRPWTAFSYMFLHGGFSHILFNMLSLYFFGPALEMRLGTRHFVQLYVFSGLVGALCSLVTPGAFIIGASGAVFGVTLGFAWFWPRQQIYLWGILGVEARWMVVAMTVISLWSGITPGAGGGVAHFTHLGGYLGAWLYLVWMRSRSPAAQWQRKVSPPRPRITFAADLERYRKVNPETLHPVNREEYHRVMSKASTEGLGALNAAERDFLERFAPRA